MLFIITCEYGPKKHKSSSKRGDKFARRYKGMPSKAKVITFPSNQRPYPTKCKETQTRISSLGKEDNMLGELRWDRSNQTFLQCKVT